MWEFARQQGLRAIVHIRLNPEPLLALGRCGFIRPGDEFIHCTHLNEAAWRLVKESSGFTSHSPHVEMAMAHGMPSIQDALDRAGAAGGGGVLLKAGTYTLNFSDAGDWISVFVNGKHVGAERTLHHAVGRLGQVERSD